MLPDQLPIVGIPDGLPGFVDHVLLASLTSAARGSIWCLQWREHPDAVTRLAAIWDAWGHLLGEEDPSLHTFLRDVLDHHLPKLVDSEKGAFQRCADGHKTPVPLNIVKAGTGGGKKPTKSYGATTREIL